MSGGRARLTLWDIPPAGPPRPAGAAVDVGLYLAVGPLLAFTPDGHTVLVGLGPQTQQWDVTDLAHPTPRPGPPADALAGASDVLFSGDGHRMLSFTWSRPDPARLWDISNPHAPRLLSSLPAPPGAALHAACLDDSGRTVVLNSDAGTVRWDVADPADPAPAPPLPGSSGGIACRPGLDTVVTEDGSRTTFQLWDIRDPARPAVISGDPRSGRPTAWSPDRRLLATTTMTGQVQLWDVADPSSPSAFGGPLPAGPGPSEVRFSPDDRTVATFAQGNPARLWRLPPLAPIGGPGDDGSSHPNQVSASGDLLAVAGPTSTRLWRVTARAVAVPLGLVAGGTPAVAPDGSWIATGGPDGVHLTDLRDPAQPRALGGALPDTTSVRANPRLAVSPDGQLLVVSADADPTITDSLWDVSDRARPQRVGVLPPEHPYSGFSLFAAFLPGSPGNRIAVANPLDGLQLWDATDLRRVHRLPAQPMSGGSVGELASAARLLAASTSAGVQLLDVTDPRRPVPVGPTVPGPGLLAGSGTVAMAPDGATVAITTGSGVRLWDVSDPAHPMPVGGPVPGRAAAFGTGFLVTSGGTVVQLWDLDPERAAARICAATSGVLTAANWPTYAGPGVAYEPPCR